MFTGIVQLKAEVFEQKKQSDFVHLTVRSEPRLIDGLETGASIAVNGVCLTAVNFYQQGDYSFVEFDIIDETLRLSNLSQLQVGNIINLERSLKVGDEIGGHMVSGHVHTTAKLIVREQSQDNCRLQFEFDNKYSRFVFEKGFVTINGISLTLGEVGSNTFNVHLIPETLSRTNLANLTLDDKVNIEFDQQTITTVTTVERYLSERN